MNHHLPPPRLTSLTLLTAVLLLAGCASAIQPAGQLPATPTPSDWSTPTDAALPGQPAGTLAMWWNNFNDPQLTELVTLALQANTNIRNAQFVLQQARALRDVAAANRLPTVSASASAQGSNTVNTNTTTNTYKAGFDASWEPDVFGARRSALSATEADAEAASANLAQIRVSMAAEVAVSYIELRGLQSRLTIARNNLATQNETLQITSWRHQAGLASSLDLEQAITAAEQTRAQIPTLDISIRQNMNLLAVLTGQAPGTLQRTLGTAATVPQAAQNLAVAFPADTLRQRPDVRTAEQRIGAALARVAQADAARYPSFKLSGSLGLNAARLEDLTGPTGLVRTLLASVTGPLFDAGAAKAQVRAQTAALEQARVNYEATVLSALQDVENALVALQGNRERVARLQAAADAATNAELLARHRYASGLIDFRSVLETQRTLLTTQDNLASTRTTLSADHVRLYKALGGGWTPDTPSAQP